LEPELVLRNGALYIPWMLPLDILNHRPAASHCLVTKVGSLRSPSQLILLIESQGAFELQISSQKDNKGDKLRLTIAASSVRTLSCGKLGSLYACIGHETTSNDKILALCPINSSVIIISENQILYYWTDGNQTDEDSALLGLLLTHALARNVLHNIKRPAWIHGAPDELREVIDVVAREEGVTVFQTTSNLARASDPNFVHPYGNGQDLYELCPKELQSFLSLEDSQNESLLTLIRKSSSVSAIAGKSIKDLVITSSLRALQSG